MGGSRLCPDLWKECQCPIGYFRRKIVFTHPNSQILTVANYPINIGPLEVSFPEWWKGQHYPQLFILADHNTARHCLPQLLSVVSDLPHQVCTIPAGETYKTLATCQQVWSAMQVAHLDRRGLVLNLGGGVVGDLGGFCAAAWKRGVDFVQVPTSLLAMTDAAIGGKTGVDLDGVKNAIGVFRDPAAVLVEARWLHTLPERELRSGLAEVMKHALIGDPELLEVIEYSQNLVQRDDVPLAFWQELLSASIAVKMRIVTDDPHERGLRMLLNYGHTIGHAVESYALKTPFPLTHGEAVALGMICETWLARTRIPDGHNWLARTLALLSRSFLHHPVPEAAFAEIWQFMLHDKKNAVAQVRAAVPTGQPFGMEVIHLSEQDVYDSLRFYNDLTE